MARAFRPTPLAVAIASALAGSTLLVGCSEEEVDVSIYADVPSCVKAGEDMVRCQEGFAEAEAAHAQLAPRFTAQADCEAEFGSGACGTADAAEVSDSGGGSFFYPLLAGYMIGSALRGPAQPLYRSTSGQWRNPAGNNLGTATGKTTAARSVASASPAQRTTVSSRGGFSAPRASSSFGG